MTQPTLEERIEAAHNEYIWETTVENKRVLDALLAERDAK